MKKIDYYKLCRNEKTKELEFIKSTGYLEKVFNSDLTDSVNVVYEKADSGFWNSTHFESGLLICVHDSTRKNCIENTKERVDAVLRCIKRKDVQEYIEQLSELRNNEIIGAMK